MRIASFAPGNLKFLTGGRPLSYVMGRLRRETGRLAYNSKLYDWSLGGQKIPELVCTLADPWPGDEEAGRWLCSGAYEIAGTRVELHGAYWEPYGVPAIWIERMHSFDWLRDLRAVGGDSARARAREMVASWISYYHRWDETIWRADLLGRRIANWLAFYDFFAASADSDFQLRLKASLTRQARHLARALPADLHGLPLIDALRGLLYAGLAFEGREAWIDQALDFLQDEVAHQLAADGAHITRNPANHAEFLRLIIDIRAALGAADLPVPPWLQHGIDKAAPVMRFFRHGDKGLALFNGTKAGNTGWLDAIQMHAGSRSRIMKELSESGYHRLSQGRTLMMVDTGTAPPWPYDGDVHASPLALELSYGRERIFVNCGTSRHDPQWRDVMRATAAHTGLSLDYRNAMEIAGDGHIGRRRPYTPVVTRQEEDGVHLLDASHDGYVPLNGIMHRRRLFMGGQGHDIRGEDSLTCTTGLNRPIEVAVRFHLHPRVQVSLIQKGREALLRLAGGSGWRFHHSGGGVLMLEESIYMDSGTRPQKTHQLVIYGTMDSDLARLKWALQREGAA